VPSLCPRSYAHGILSTGNGSFLATDFLNLGSRSRSSASTGSGPSLAVKLANLHTTPAPIPEGFKTPQFGFPVTTCCGSTKQPNDYSNSWADFFANQRLRAILRSCEERQGKDRKLRELVEMTVLVVVPRLLGDDHLNSGKGVMPVVVHGDLWTGNHGNGSVGNGQMEEVVFDPSSCYAHSEYELGIMLMFGGYGDAFFAEYHKLKPKDEPVGEYVGRMQLYEL
jgi:fructosamine-3-kinase